MNIHRGLKRIYLAALVAWVAAFFWFYGSELHFLLLPSGLPGETCNQHFTDGTQYYCNAMTEGDYPMFARVMFFHVGTHVAILLGAPVAVWVCYRVSLWIVAGFRPAV